MDIKFGFADTSRELIVSSTSEQAELTQKINSALAENSTLELEDDKGRKYLVRTDRVVYVEVGAAKKQSVGFAGA
ncbi:DUF3107 family protein [Corynebacterium macginleyi]|uniref:DUF3107 family protein n=1 Tax=Corynebacterium macginleyi TaxID=38290 RepID=UPI00190C17F5|nr:DUF3107 domain-containing protein [Corynebacterium macginleyi]